jgi:hypothetical protein
LTLSAVSASGMSSRAPSWPQIDPTPLPARRQAPPCRTARHDRSR